ncbi:hypothetical protein K9L97_03730 [Candidatus Woesearchaeota archaeon]|nr:hypothetical protein [Candidatus Woesearchaeota archaeon]
MNKITDIQDQSVRQLAMTLRQSGLAASETEAIRMATAMSFTSNKVNKTFEDRKDGATMGLSHLNKTKPNNEPATKPQTQTSDIDPQTTNTRTETTESKLQSSNYEPQTTEQYMKPKENTEPTLNELYEEKTTKPETKPETTHSIQIEEDEELIKQDLIESNKDHKPETQTMEHRQQTQYATQNSDNKQITEPEIQTTEPDAKNEEQNNQTPERKPPRKRFEDMAESKVDLGSVFNFNK